MRVLRDVVLHRAGPGELLALSQAPGLTGEEMTLDVLGGGTSMGLRVRVVESRPVMVDGAVRHRLRLELLDARAGSDERLNVETAGDLLADGGGLPAEVV